MGNIFNCRAKNPLTCPYHGLAQFDNKISLPPLPQPSQAPPVVFQPGQTMRNGKEIIFKTVHGSKLYGLDHAKSDNDFYIVLADDKGKVKPHQTIVDTIDTMSLGLAEFDRLAHKGVPQVLEAMFSRQVVGDPIESYRKSYRASDPEVIRTYFRTIKSFSLSEEFKRRRHAIRLVLNLNELIKTERFNPTLTPEQAQLITERTNRNEKTFSQYQDFMNKLSILELDWEPTLKASDKDVT